MARNIKTNFKVKEELSSARKKNRGIANSVIYREKPRLYNISNDSGSDKINIFGRFFYRIASKYEIKKVRPR
jgi:hypothetical protein